MHGPWLQHAGSTMPSGSACRRPCAGLPGSWFGVLVGVVYFFVIGSCCIRQSSKNIGKLIATPLTAAHGPTVHPIKRLRTMKAERIIHRRVRKKSAKKRMWKFGFQSECTKKGSLRMLLAFQKNLICWHSWHSELQHSTVLFCRLMLHAGCAALGGKENTPWQELCPFGFIHAAKVFVISTWKIGPFRIQSLELSQCQKLTSIESPPLNIDDAPS